jgi:hypothetical protein
MMFKNRCDAVASIYDTIKGIAEDSARNGSLFHSYRDDLYVHDRDTLDNDAQAGDVWLWILKGHGTWIGLVEKDASWTDAILAGSLGEEDRRYFLLVIPGAGIPGAVREYTSSTIKEAINDVRVREDRVPRRTYLSACLAQLDARIAQSVAATDIHSLSTTVGAQALLKICGGSISYVVPSKGLTRSHGCSYGEPLSYRIRITSRFGHAEVAQVSAAVFNSVWKRTQARSGNVLRP